MYILLLVPLVLNAQTSLSNHTGSIMKKNIKDFVSIGNKNNEHESQLVIPRTTVASSNILSVIHDLPPKVLPRSAVPNITEEDELPIQSRETDEYLSNPGDSSSKIDALCKRILDSIKSKPERRCRGTIQVEDYRKLMAHDWLGLIGHEENQVKSLEETLLNSTTKLTVLITRLNDLLERLNENILTLNSRSNEATSFFIMKMPLQSSVYGNLPSLKRKREIQNETSKVTTVFDGHNISDTKNDTENKHIHKEDEDKNDTKNKLLEYLKSSFDDIRKQIASVVEIKDAYSEDDAYKIGYALAIIDTLDINLAKLLQNLEKNRFVWDEKKLVDLFAKLKQSQRVVNKLSDYVTTLAR